MAKSIHDHRLVSYAVNERTRRITFETVSIEATPNEPTDVIFAGVEAYFFENHALPVGTVFYDIVEIEAGLLVENYWELFEKGRVHGWPGPWGETKAKASAFFTSHKVRGYEVNSSCGLRGWVMAKEMKIQRRLGSA